MKGIIFCESLTYDITTESSIKSRYHYSDIGGIRQIMSIEFDDLEFKTYSRIEKNLGIKPLILFLENETVIYDKGAYFKEEVATVEKENKIEYKYVVGLNAPKIYVGLKESEKSMEPEVIHFIKMNLIKKRFEQNKK